jgi:hypothetical protein
MHAIVVPPPYGANPATGTVRRTYTTIYNRLRLAREDFARALRREDAAIYVRRK